MWIARSPRGSHLSYTVAFVIALALVANTTRLAGDQLRASANVNMVGGPASIEIAGGQVLKILGDPYLQRQNEPSMACSSFDPQMCLAASNDTRLVNAPGLPTGVTGDSWLGIYWTFDGGKTWKSSMLPGFLQDASSAGAASPLKGKEAAADPTVRAGADGLFYVSGIAFNRADEGGPSSAGVEGKKGVTFVAVYKDPQDPNKEPEYQGSYVVDSGSSGQFLDKPWIAVDIPRPGATCGTVYFAETVFTGSGTPNQSKVLVSYSTNCGRTWANFTKVSESFQVNQSANLAIHPVTGEVYLTWRVFPTANSNVEGQILFSRSANGRTWSKPTVVRSLGPLNASLAPDQGTLPGADPPNDQYRMFRTNAYPSMCVTTDNAVRIAFAERKGGNPEGDARIMVAKLAGGSWSIGPVDDHAGRGHQLMPAMACSGRTATIAFYDQRNDSAPKAFGDGLFTPFIWDLLPPPPTHTLDVRAARTAANGNFAPSIQVSRYRFIRLLGSLMQLDYNAVNWPLFGKFPFIGDYIDLTPDRTIVTLTRPDGTTESRFFGTTPADDGESARMHVTWTDNRDVLPSFLDYLRPDPNAAGVSEPPGAWVTLDANGQEVQENWQAPGPQCTATGRPTANKNQNVYTATLSDGLLVGALDESRSAGDLRAYAIYVTNTTGSNRRFVVTTTPGSFSRTNPSENSRSVDIPAHNTRGVTVFVSGAPRTTVVVTEVDLALPLPYEFLHLKRTVVLNPAPGTIDLEDHTVGLSFNDLTTIENPIFDPENPIFDVENPIFDVENPIFDVENPIFDVENPIFDPENPIFDPENPIIDPENPIFEPENPIFDVENAAVGDGEPTAYDQPKLTQVQASVINEGTVASGYDLTATIAALPTDVIWQLLVMRVATSPTTPPVTLGDPCNVLNVPRFEALTNIGTTLDHADTSFVLRANEKAFVLLRLYHSDDFTLAQQQVSMKVSSQSLPTVFDSFGNTAPVASDLAGTTPEDMTLTSTLSASDAEGDTLTYAIVGGPSHGTVVLGANGSFTYTPAANYSGNDGFTFTANDGFLSSNVATFSIVVTAVNDPPAAVAQSVTTAENTAVAISLTAADVDSATLAYSIVAGPSHGTLSGAPPSVTYTPGINYEGPDSFTFGASDGSLSSTAVVAITVTSGVDFFGFNGLLGSYQPPPKSYNLGSAVPISWQYTNATTGAVVDTGHLLPTVTFSKLKATNNNCTSPVGEQSPLIEGVNLFTNVDSPGNSFFNYGSGTWKFNWQSAPPVTAGCWNVRIYSGQGQVNGPFPIRLTGK